MKIYKIFFPMVLALAVSCKGEKEAEAVVLVPEAEFSFSGQPASDLTVVDVDTTITFTARVTNTDVFSCGWYIDGQKMCNTTALTYFFDTPGSYTMTFHAQNVKGELKKDFALNVNGAPLEVVFSVQDESIETTINSQVEVSATVVSGDKGTLHQWRVGEDLRSETNMFQGKFAVPGEYQLSYYGINADMMSASRQWLIKVMDLPLAARFFPSANGSSTVAGATLAFTSDVTAGRFGLKHSWSVDGVSCASVDSVMTHYFPSAGEYKVKYTATNDQKDELTNEWTVSVGEYKAPKDIEGVKSSLLYDDFESSEYGPSTFYTGNKVSNVSVLRVVDNPYRTATNSSSKVMLDKGSLITWASSSYVQFNASKKPDGSAVSDRSKYTMLRIKVYVGSEPFTPLLMENKKSTYSTPCYINGEAFDTETPDAEAWKEMIHTNDWNIFVYDLAKAPFSTAINSFADCDQYQLRACVDFNNTALTPADVLFDDLELLEPEGSEPGPEPEPEPEPEEGVLVFDTFEASSGVSSFYIGNVVSGVNVLSVVDNPYKTSSNSSSKVLIDAGSKMNYVSSSYFKFKIGTYPDGTTELSATERAKYTKVRVKVYLGTTGFTPLLQEDNKSTKSAPSVINGVAFDAANPSLEEWNKLIKTNDWNTFVYDLSCSKYSSQVNNLSQTGQFQFRVSVDFSNTNKLAKDVYFDDICFME